MATKLVLSCLLLGSLWLSANGECDLTTTAKAKEFPNLKDLGKLSYQMTVLMTITNDKIKQSDFVKESYNVQLNQGRLDIISNSQTATFLYFKESNETFEVFGQKCMTGNIDVTPLMQTLNFKLLSEAAVEWYYKDEIRGPSAMFANALEIWEKEKEGKMAYMGELPEDQLIDGLNAQYWRRCIGEQTVDYFFTTDDHEDAYGFEDLRQVPLRVQFGESTTETDFFPQTYDILSFQPFVSNIIETFQVPSGLGCRRSVNLTDVPDLPHFDDKSLFTFGDASYTYRDQDEHLYNYINSFAYARDTQTDLTSYFYTHWGGSKREQTPDGYLHIIYDEKQGYLYKMDLFTDICTISRMKSYGASYSLPENGGSIDLNDPAVFFTNNEFSYITETKDRGYKVHVFEWDQPDFNLGNRTVPRAVMTHSYIINDITIDAQQTVKNTPTSYQFKFYTNGADKPPAEQLTMSIYGFSSRIPGRRYIFNIQKCFKNDDDYLWVNIGFPTDKAILDKIITESPTIRLNVMELLMRESELTPMRVPYIFVDMADMLYVTIMILDRPPVMLDYLVAESGKTIENADAMEGQMSLDDCANACLESQAECWGFSFCGAVCYMGGEKQTNVKAEKDCQFYRRYSNDSAVPTKEKIADGLKSLVDGEGFKIAVPNLKDEYSQPFFLKATYFEISGFEGSQGAYRTKKVTDPRLRVVKTGFKLNKVGDDIRNFGKLGYEECQRLCLDYQQCETISYCGKDSSCVLSKLHGEDIPETSMAQDNYCSILSRKYADQFERSGGLVMVANEGKKLKITKPEECARSCVQEKSFDCKSFDLCPSYEDACILRTAHKLQLTDDDPLKKDTGCGHYSKKFSYIYKRQEQKKSVGVGFIASTNVTLEECAKTCSEYEGGFCYGFDFCEDKTITSSICTLLNKNPADFKTAYTPVCAHFTQESLASPGTVSKSKAAWVGIVCFIVAAVFGVLLTYGIAYFRANKAT